MPLQYSDLIATVLNSLSWLVHRSQFTGSFLLHLTLSSIIVVSLSHVIPWCWGKTPKQSRHPYYVKGFWIALYLLLIPGQLVHVHWLMGCCWFAVQGYWQPPAHVWWANPAFCVPILVSVIWASLGWLVLASKLVMDTVQGLVELWAWKVGREMDLSGWGLEEGRGIGVVGKERSKSADLLE